MNRTFHLPTLFFLLIVVIFVFVETTLRVEKVFDLCSDRVERVRSFLLIPGSSSVTLRKSPYHFLLLRTIRFSVHPVCSRGDTTPHPPDNRQDGAVHRQQSPVTSNLWTLSNRSTYRRRLRLLIFGRPVSNAHCRQRGCFHVNLCIIYSPSRSDRPPLISPIGRLSRG